MADTHRLPTAAEIERLQALVGDEFAPRELASMAVDALAWNPQVAGVIAQLALREHLEWLSAIAENLDQIDTRLFAIAQEAIERSVDREMGVR